MKIVKVMVLLIPVFFLAYSIFFEPYQLESTFHEVTIGRSGKSLLVAHVTDLHTDGLGAVELKLIDVIQSNKPEIVLITGDVATPDGTAKGYKDVLSKIKAPLGVYFIQGNWEYWEPVQELSQILRDINIIDLTNKSTLIKDDLWLIGLDDALAGSPNLKTYEDVPKKSKILSMFHSPELFKSVSMKTDLAFAGHSHGGQVRFPIIGALWTPEGTGKYDAGWFQEGRGRLYVSRGIGNSILPIRFNCKPEVAFIKVNY